MEVLMNSEATALINALLYTIALVYFAYKNKFSVGVVIWALYVLASWATYLFIQHPLYSTGIHYSETIFPYIYMFVLNFVAMYPLMKFKTIPEVMFNKKTWISLIMIGCSFIQLVFIIIDIPNVISILKTPLNMLVEIRDAGYESNTSLIEGLPLLNKINLIYSGFRIFASGLSIYFLLTLKKKRKLVWLFFITTLLNNIRLIINQAGRGEIILLFILYFCIFYSLRALIDKKRIRLIMLCVIPLIAVGLAFFWSITVSRFGQFAEYSLYKYLGEPMNNFNGLLFYKIEGYTNGRAYFSLLYRYLFGEADFISVSEKWKLINSLTGINGSIFYGWIGGLIIEFGKIAPIFIAVLLNRMMSHVCSLEQYRVGDLLICIFFINFYIRGIFYFPTQNFEGVFSILFMFIFYFVFRIRKNQNSRWVFVLPKNKK
jgi:oligosaccharide repeat unit polymerase